ncbi:chemotaxis protein CheW [Heyndrickxia ginsengihumi]|uniref:Chemotaxis protein CheW n=1 Tax=Heyndrickxia ginsengihumi TaxID=363870 RepID=A0A0A6VEW8_9BACI|nr:chemotaxis protein CheW [Heyndrickxia ginsengihumi]KHD86013.1 chemotaxis protein CheW [Heyndrickxia ginsengihumi]MBE6182937.1 chemotaxis protein CheW [Bacillus sp. (in: firmicutes)]NEY20107.1 chemotaxis protein CheW [Heyndrickxia ginsengihumi]
MNILEKYLVFKVGEEEYGISIQSIISIEKIDKIRRIPQLPNYVKGIVKVRDELIPVIDLQSIMYQSPLQVDDQVRLIVLQTAALSIGLLVEEASDIIEIPEEAMKQIGLIAYQKTQYFSAIANLENRLITIIDPDILVNSLDGIKEIVEYMDQEKLESESITL